tara:strand:- start:906 stop:1322 length:417 start_codon:yes stop_codon:yes gene_type:complete
MDNLFNWTRIKNDTNGNPRYVIHFLNLNTKEELESITTDNKYNLALTRAKKIGGRKYHNKQYGGGIAFVSYSLPELEKHILRIKGEVIDINVLKNIEYLRKAKNLLDRVYHNNDENINKFLATADTCIAESLDMLEGV